MRYSITEDERTSDKNYESIKDEEIELVDEEIEFVEDEITEKIPIEKFCQIHNTPLIFDDPAAFVRIVLLKAKPEYINYYGPKVYAVIVKTENNDAWFGAPVKNSQIGLIRWSKTHWDRIYGFSMSMSIEENT